METKVKRSFILGDEWLYFKIYTGIKSADEILINYLKPIFNELLNDSIIDKWFFIRYSDPDFHLRIRIHLTNTDNLEIVVKSLNLILNDLLNFDLIWKIQYDTYVRELERYGDSIIEHSESLFFHDSIMISDAIEIIDNEEDPNLKWMWGLMIIDNFMNDFDFTLDEKAFLMNELRDNFGNELGLNKNLKKQMSQKFNRYKLEIENCLNKKNQNLELMKLIEIKSLNITEHIKHIKNFNNDFLNVYSIVATHIHMIMNRLFRFKNRHNEFVIYQFLVFYYESKIARIKYDSSYISTVN